MTERYPTFEGLPMRPEELMLPPSRLDPNKKGNFSNHHLCYTARAMGKFATLQTLRDLDSMQVGLPNDLHNHGWYALHTQYEPPRIDMEAAYRRVYEEYENGGRLRKGSFNSPHYSFIDLSTMQRIEAEHDRHGERVVRLGVYRGTNA